MSRDVQGGNGPTGRQREQVQWVALDWLVADAVAHPALPFLPEDVGHRLAEEGDHRLPQPPLAVLAGLHDRQVPWPQHQQGAVVLDTAGCLHGLRVAIGDRDAVPLDAVRPLGPG